MVYTAGNSCAPGGTRLVGALVGAAKAHVNDWAVERGPGLENAIAGHIVERPLHRDALDVEFAPIVAMGHDLRRIQATVAGLDRIPAQSHPVRVRFLFTDFERPRSRVMGHLNLAAEVGTVDEVARMIFAGDEM